MMITPRLVSWLVSNCGNTRSTTLRFQYAGSLSYAGLEIDQFGACNDEQFPIIDKWDPAVFQVLSRYKFYLSFENSFHCRDYLTEKIWMNALYSGAVPVIFGPHRDDVRSLLPPKSYIFAESFESPARLVEFLRYLDKNATAYSEYLQWRTWGKYLGRDPSDLPRPIRGYFGDSPAGFCSLASVTSGKVVGDVEEAWLGRERKECLDVDDAYDILFPL